MKSTIINVLIVLLLAVFTCLPGCLSVQPAGGGAPQAGDGSQLQVNFIQEDPSWNLARGCTWAVEYQVSNRGDREARNVRVEISLSSADSGAVRDTREIYLGTLAPGSSKAVTAELDGECLKEYTVRATAYSDT